MREEAHFRCVDEAKRKIDTASVKKNLQFLSEGFFAEARRATMREEAHFRCVDEAKRKIDTASVKKNRLKQKSPLRREG